MLFPAPCCFTHHLPYLRNTPCGFTKGKFLCSEVQWKCLKQKVCRVSPQLSGIHERDLTRSGHDAAFDEPNRRVPPDLVKFRNPGQSPRSRTVRRIRLCDGSSGALWPLSEHGDQHGCNPSHRARPRRRQRSISGCPSSSSAASWAGLRSDPNVCSPSPRTAGSAHVCGAGGSAVGSWNAELALLGRVGWSSTLRLSCKS